MSVVSVQLGQCGNQVGSQLFSTILEDAYVKNTFTHVPTSKNQEYIQNVCSRFFTEVDDQSAGSHGCRLRARAILVDMESKVIAQSVADAKLSRLWAYSEKQQFCQKRGSGNNWAHGYCVHGPAAEEKILNMVQTEVEKCDYFGGFLALMSLAGGTGSGVGAYITQSLRDAFPHSFIINQVVWPYNTGEVIVQNYNAFLTLSHLYQTADAILVMENDNLHRICSQLLNIQKISFKDINRVIAHKLASFLQPTFTGESHDLAVSNHLGDLLDHMVPHPEYKLLTVKNIPQIADKSMQFSTFQWHGLLKHLRQMLIADAPMEEGIDWQVSLGDQTPRGGAKYNHSLANLLSLRGKDIHTADTSAFGDSKLYTDWVPPECTLLQWNQPRAFNKYEKSASLLSNSRSTIGPLGHVISKAWSMFSARAYVHQYVRYGMSEEDFLDGFSTLEQVLASYRKL